MDPKRVAEIEQMLTNRHDMLHYNMKALRRAGLDLLVEMRSKELQLHEASIDFEVMATDETCAVCERRDKCEVDCATTKRELWRQKAGGAE